jgi:CRISPR-associated protein (TIGR02584 family)
MLPVEYKKIFIAVVGKVSHIITETIYALPKKDPLVHTDEMYIITTSEGKRKAKETPVEECISKSTIYQIINKINKEFKEKIAKEI